MKEVLGRKVKFSTLVIIRLFIITPNWIVLQCILKFLEIPLVGNVITQSHANREDQLVNDMR